MRESIGGTWLTGIVITFLALFAGFLAYSISYTKAFRVKDNIIQIIEQNEGFTTAANTKQNMLDSVTNAREEDLILNGSAEAEIFNFIQKIGYNYSTNISCKNDENENEDVFGTAKYGYCLEKHCTNSANVDKVYYKVTTYISLQIPVVNVTVQIPISGETTTLYYDSTGMNNANTDDKCYSSISE